MKHKILESYKLKDRQGEIQLIELQDAAGGWILGWNAADSLNDPVWNFNVYYFSTYHNAKREYDRRYLMDKNWGLTE